MKLIYKTNPIRTELLLFSGVRNILKVTFHKVVLSSMSIDILSICVVSFLHVFVVVFVQVLFHKTRIPRSVFPLRSLVSIILFSHDSVSKTWVMSVGTMVTVSDDECVFTVRVFHEINHVDSWISRSRENVVDCGAVELCPISLLCIFIARHTKSHDLPMLINLV